VIAASLNIWEPAHFDHLFRKAPHICYQLLPLKSSCRGPQLQCMVTCNVSCRNQQCWSGWPGMTHSSCPPHTHTLKLSPPPHTHTLSQSPLRSAAAAAGAHLPVPGQVQQRASERRHTGGAAQVQAHTPAQLPGPAGVDVWGWGRRGLRLAPNGLAERCFCLAMLHLCWLNSFSGSCDTQQTEHVCMHCSYAIRKCDCQHMSVQAVAVCLQWHG
jgi:hypothetical protein